MNAEIVSAAGSHVATHRLSASRNQDRSSHGGAKKLWVYEMSERIFLTYTNASSIPYQGSVLGHHIVLNYIDSNGKHYTLQGMPERKFDHNADKLIAFLQEERWSDGAKNRDSPFQRLMAHELEGDGIALSRPHTMIAEGDDLRSQWNQMTKFGNDVNSIGYEYRPYSQNSNSFAAEALKRAGFFGPGTAYPEIFRHLLVVDPVSGATRSVSVPGFDQRLLNPLTELTTGSNEPAIPFPVDVRLGGEGQDLLDRRFVRPVSGRLAREGTSFVASEDQRDAGRGGQQARAISNESDPRQAKCICVRHRCAGRAVRWSRRKFRARQAGLVRRSFRKLGLLAAGHRAAWPLSASTATAGKATGDRQRRADAGLAFPAAVL